MLANFKKPIYILFCLIVLTLLLRIINYSFPNFTADEARIAYRAFSLSHFGKDELGRSFPFVFNSLTDYQLPFTSYLAALGVWVFGKNDFGVRIPFVILGTLIVWITYKIAQSFSDKRNFPLFSALVLIFSPALIFLSKVPNDEIVLAFFVTLLFYILLKDKLNMILIIFVTAILFTISKFAWFITTPFITFTIFFYKNNLSRRSKIKLFLFYTIMTVFVVGFYLRIPQSRRSFLENNFSIFSSSTIKNGIDKSRGQGLDSLWSYYLEVGLFNKTFFPVIGFMHWLSNLQPSIYFGQFDETGQMNFSQMGVLSKILILPFIWGLIYLIRQGRRKDRLLLLYVFILTFPAIFIYPDFNQGLIVSSLPFIALIIAFGFTQFNKAISLLIVFLMVLELGLNLLYLIPEKRNTNFLRPSWIKEIVVDIYNQSQSFRTAVSDDITNDVISFIEWYNPVDKVVFLNVSYPYKFRQSNLKNITLVGSDNKFYPCKEENYKYSFLSKRDKDQLANTNIKIVKTYHDNLDQEIAYLVEKGLCIK